MNFRGSRTGAALRSLIKMSVRVQFNAGEDMINIPENGELKMCFMARRLGGRKGCEESRAAEQYDRADLADIV